MVRSFYRRLELTKISKILMLNVWLFALVYALQSGCSSGSKELEEQVAKDHAAKMKAAWSRGLALSRISV